MRTEVDSEHPGEVAQHGEDLPDLTGYEDGDSYVVCEKTNPNAWVRSDETADLSR